MHSLRWVWVWVFFACFGCGDEQFAPTLRLLPAEPDDEKRTLRVLVSQGIDGAIAGTRPSSSLSPTPLPRPASADLDWHAAVAHLCLFSAPTC